MAFNHPNRIILRPLTEADYLRQDEEIARREARHRRRLDWDEIKWPRSSRPKPAPERKEGAK